VTVQRVIGALVVFGGKAALKHVAWVDFDDGGEPLFPEGEGLGKGQPTISRPPPAAAGSVCARIDAALNIYTKRATEATGELVPAVLGDVAAYARAKAAALAEPGADAAIAELVQLTKKAPQPFGPCTKDDDLVHKSVIPESKGAKPVPYTALTGDFIAAAAADSVDRRLPPSGLARAKALAWLADPHAPPPTALAHALHTQHRAVAGSKWLYEIISNIAQLVGVELGVLPGGVKRLPRTVFKCAVN
jgi:hypothetical protein